MKKLCWIILVCIAVGALTPAFAETGKGADRPRIILYTYYRQMGWGDRVQAGCVDEKGGLWLMTGYDSQLKWPYGVDEQLAYLRSSENLTLVDTLTSDGLFDLKGLILTAQDQGSRTLPAANDAGTERSFAVLYDADGTANALLLGASGDDFFENTDVNAQALYQRLRQWFPQVTSYAGVGGMGPIGFLPVSLRAFCGWPDFDADQAVITAAYMDCEAGSIPLELSETEEKDIRRLVSRAVVTGKANATFVTGGTAACFFYDQEGRCLASLELYHGLLVWRDGMYTLELQ